MEAGQTGTSTSFNFSADVVEGFFKKRKGHYRVTTRQGWFFSIVKYKESWELGINPKNGTLYNVNISMYFKAVH